MGHMACTEPQCLYSRAISLLPLWNVRPVQRLSACTVELYLYSHYGPYGLYRASVPVQYSYTSTPPMGSTDFTEPQFLYSRATPLLPLWAVRPVQSLSSCTRVHFTFTFLNSNWQGNKAVSILWKHTLLSHITWGCVSEFVLQTSEIRCFKLNNLFNNLWYLANRS
jgi:hypothetical protein